MCGRLCAVPAPGVAVVVVVVAVLVEVLVVVATVVATVVARSTGMRATTTRDWWCGVVVVVVLV